MVGLGGLGVERTYVLRPWSLGLEQRSQVCLLVCACVCVCSGGGSGGGGGVCGVGEVFYR